MGMPTFEEVRSQLLRILGQTSFGEDVMDVRFTGFHYARGLRSIDEAVPGLAELQNSVLEVIYTLGEKLAKRDKEMAFNFFMTAPDAVTHFSVEDLEKWVELGLELADAYGVVPARNFFKGITRETIEKIHSHGLEFQDVARVLEIYMNALSGDKLGVQEAHESYTDTRTVFLPSKVEEFESDELNFRVYKVMAAYRYAQLRYRSLEPRLGRMEELINELQQRYGRSVSSEREGLENFIHLFPEEQLALDIFSVVEGARIERNLRREFRGIARDMDMLLEREWERRPEPGRLGEREGVIEGLMQLLTYGRTKGELTGERAEVVKRAHELVQEMLQKERPTVEDSCRVTAEIYRLVEERLPASPYPGFRNVPFRGVIKPEQVTAGLKKTKKEMAQKLESILEELDIEKPPDIDSMIQHAFNEVPDPLAYGAPLDFLFRLGLDIPDEVQEEILREIEKLLGELGEIDASMLMKVLDSAGRKIRANIQARVTEFQVELTEEDMKDAYMYDEWDYKVGNYRAAWCALKERVMPKGSDRFVEKTLEKHSGLVSLIRRQFEMLRPDYRRLFKQMYGEEIDLDAFVEAFADMKAGATPSEKLYIKIDKKDRDIAVAFLVDLSGSTTGWVIETEKEALVLMCEALEVLDDKYAIFGFSGKTRKQCDFYIIKRFDEPYDDTVKQRIAGMDAFDYTRMGPPIRHVTKILEETPAKIKLLIVLSDGKPEDFDEYKGDHGIEDTKKALIEAKRKQIRPFCITIDTEARDYIQRMFGEIGYIILDDVAKLPRKLPEIYRRLTT